jgi:hypothetical protein
MKLTRRLFDSAANAADLCAAATCSASSRAPPLVTANLNQAVVQAAYAVRGELVMKADALREKLTSQGAAAGLPFDQIVACNIGNPHELGQQPITFFRQVLALMHYPALLKEPKAKELFAPDAIERAQKYLAEIHGGTGAYTTSQGIRGVRAEVAEFLQRRDGVPANVDDIFLTDGASAGVKMLLNLIVRGKEDGVLTPIPQYPLYSASLTLFGGECVKYFLDESKGWGLTVRQRELTKMHAECTNEWKRRTEHRRTGFAIRSPRHRASISHTKRTHPSLIFFSCHCCCCCLCFCLCACACC